MAWLKCRCRSNKGICGMDCKPCDLDCGSYHEAKALYNAGYRKASEVAEEIFAEIEKVAEIGRIMNACAIVSLDELAELKKKYTEMESDNG